MTWKDRRHPAAGGAEVVNEELAKRLVRDGHQVTFLVGGFAGGEREEMRDGFRIVRLGSRFSVYWHVFRYYRKHLMGLADLVIDEVNTIPFFAAWYTRVRTVLFVHQLAREIWFYEMGFPFSLIGYLAEAVYLRCLSGSPVVTVSESTKRDLMRFGFKPDRIQIISEGIEMEPVATLAEAPKAPEPTMLAFGTIRSMKRTGHIVRAFELAKARIPNLKLIVAGKPEGTYGEKVLAQIKASPFASDITYIGKTTQEQKKELMRTTHVMCMASVKEGWGLVVTEANSQGTPAIVYNVDGLRDSVRDGETGVVCKENNPQGMADGVVDGLADQGKYDTLRQNAWEWSGEMKFEKSYGEFVKAI